MSIGLFTSGGVIIDNVVAADGALARDLVGGNAVYAAIGARHWLDDVGVCARIPRNYPAQAHRELTRANLDLEGLTIEAVDVLRSEWFFHRPDGSRVDHLHASAEEADSFGMTGNHVPLDRAQRFETELLGNVGSGHDFKAFRAEHPVTAAQVPARYWQAKAVHLGPNLPEAQLSLARKARGLGLSITCDPGFHAASLLPAQRDELLALVDGFLPSERELSLLCPGLEPAMALAQLSERARGIVGVKCGAKGAWLLQKGHATPIHVPVLDVAAVDPTGAGDAFCGGFLAGLVLGDDALAAGVRGAVSASLAVETTGAIQPEDRRHQAAIRFEQLTLRVRRLDRTRDFAEPSART